MAEPHHRQSWQITVSAKDAEDAVSYLCRHTGLSKSRLKDAMNKGAVWLRHGRGKLRRLRRATSGIQAGDELFVYYDPELLALVPPPGKLCWQCREYSLWYKPAGCAGTGQ